MVIVTPEKGRQRELLLDGSWLQLTTSDGP
jgi:hypothetical protein